MNLLHLIASVDPAYGGPVEGLLRQNEACGGYDGPVKREVASLDAADSSYISRVPFPVHALGEGKSGSRLPWRRALEHYGYSSQYRRWLEANHSRFDAVIVHGLWNYAPFAAAHVLPRMKTPYFVFPHGMMDPWFRKTYPLKHIAKQAFWLAGEGRLLAGADAVFFTSEEERLQADGEFPIYRFNSVVVGYGASAPPPRTTEDDLAFRNLVPNLKGRRYLLFLSRIHEKKGCDLLVQAFCQVASMYPEIDLVVAGPDQAGLVASLVQAVDQSGMSGRVHFPGPLYGSAKWGALYGADAFVLPSHQENFGIAVAEALGAGTPVLISDKVNIWREIESAGAGLVGADTASDCELIIRKWLDLTTVEKDAMKSAARNLFNAKFNVNQTGPDLIATIQKYL